MYKQELILKIVNYAKKHLRTERQELDSPHYSPRSNKRSDEMHEIHELRSPLKVGPTFVTLLFQFIDQKGIDEVTLYKTIGITRAHFSKMRSDLNYQPSKDTVFKFIIGLTLTLTESNMLLESAGLAFKSSSSRDLMIKAAVVERLYDTGLIDAALFFEKLPFLFAANDETLDSK
jgi:hypothetical protein